MKLVFGFIAYLAAAAVVVTAVLAGMFTIFGDQPKQQPVLASGTDGRAAGPGRAGEEHPVDPKRVPVWITPTAKYQYTPVPVDQAPKRSAVIGLEARGAMAKSRRNSRVPDVVDRERAPSPALSQSRRDNDPFFRD
jgi:hypothetical protein